MKTAPDDCFSEDRQGITYREGVAPTTGLMIGLFGLLFVALSMGVVFEISAWPWHGGKIMGGLTALAFACFGSATVFIAIACVQPQHVRFDRDTRRLKGRMRGRLWLLRSIDVGFDALQLPIMKSSSREMGSDLYEVRIERMGHPPLALGSFEERAKAEHWQGRLMDMLKN